MLALNRRLRAHLHRDQDGAVLVTVVVVMFVGFLIAGMIAASVVFTLQSNVTNKGTTQAFIAAESGRDVAVAALADGCATTDMAGSGTGPTYTYAVRTVAKTGPNPPTNFDDLASSACPASDAWVVIRSTGTGADGSTSTVDAVYEWQRTYSDVPGGVVTYFAGSITQGVAHYTGDLVLRDGNWSCNINGLLDGDLYVLTGTVSISTGCRINGDVYANGNVTSNGNNWRIDARPSSESTGSITTNGLVSLPSTGSNSVAGNIHARGDVTLDGGGTGVVGGSVTSRNAVNANASWTTGTQVPNSPSDPVFVPTLAWLMAATQWIDLPASASWGTREPNVCTKTAAQLVSLISVSGGPLVLDLTPCSNGAAPFTGQTLDLAMTNLTVNRDVVILSPANKRLKVNISGTTQDGGATRQIFFVHVDNTADNLPTCGNGLTQDQFDVAGLVDPDVRLMVYAPCGLGGTVNASFSGQLYADDTTHFVQSSVYTCKPMTWPIVLPKLGCTIKGEDGVLDDSTIVQKLGELVYQTER